MHSLAGSSESTPSDHRREQRRLRLKSRTWSILRLALLCVLLTLMLLIPAYAPLAQEDNKPYEPPAPHLGGTCISGFILDRYDTPRGAYWNVKITPQEGQSQTRVADAEGNFVFKNLDAGVWTVELDIPEGWQAFTLPAFPVTLSGEGDACAEVRFKVEALPCLEVSVLDAHNRLGSKDMIGLAGWKIIARQANAVLNEATDGVGKAYFEDMALGEWTISQGEPVGWQPAEGQKTSQTITLSSPRQPGACQALTFINEQVTTACIRVQNTDPPGNPLKDWKITAVREDGTQPNQTQSTDTNGETLFENLELGAWLIREDVNNWWRPIGPSERSVELTIPGQCEELLFANEPLGCVDGYKVNSLDQGLADWTVTAFNPDSGELFTTTTDAEGYFQFPNLTLGAWVIEEQAKDGWEAVTPDQLEVKVVEPFTCQRVQFRNETEFACVDVFVKDWKDGAGLPGWPLSIQPAFGGAPITGVTDGTGWVRFNGLVPGNYSLSENPPPGWQSIGSGTQDVELTPSGSCSAATFEDRQEGSESSKSKQPKKNQQAKHCRTKYAVQWGDTLFGIARYYGTTVKKLAQVNHIHNPSRIYPGQLLCIR